MSVEEFSFEQFFFKTPLYEPVKVTPTHIKGILWRAIRMDGYCPFCGSSSTFDRSSSGTPIPGVPDANFLDMTELKAITFQCARDDGHHLQFYYLLADGTISKTGQYPSFADIANDESKVYSKLLDKLAAAEFHKAVGLAAHGVGIGSYVYLRRIFERLIDKRYKEYRDAEGWKDEEFYKMRMQEKIAHLKDHLPEFLVKNFKIYSILSLGIHELDEQKCLDFFPVLRQSTIWILEQDKKKKEELAQQKSLEAAIKQFEHIPAKSPTK